MNRFTKIKNTLKHKVCIFKIYFRYETKVSFWRVLMHDTDKMFYQLFLGIRIGKKIHRKYAGHHTLKTDNDFYEAYLDWASNRHTKPDKPLDAIETAYVKQNGLYEKALKHYNEVKFK